VTGTDTNVGKTVLSSLLCAALRGIYWKPIQTGATEGTDRQTVVGLGGIDVADTLPEVYVFDDPVSPHLAADRARCEISLERINLPAGNGERPLIVEGAGGVMVPINRHQFMMDLMRQLGLPVILAARSTLGTINHTLLSIGCLDGAQTPIHGIVLIGPPNPDNKRAIERYGGKQVIGEIPPLENIDRASLESVFYRHFIREAFA